jgi:cell division protein FtsI (penicillin-binding protein 3)
MKVNEKKWIRVRIYIVAVLFLCGLSTILARGTQLQVLQRDRLASIALAGYRGIVKLPPKRGTIYDREGHELAVSVEVESIYVHPHHVQNKAQAAKLLSKILEMKENALLSLLKSQRPFVWIDRKVAPEKIRQVKALGIEGIGFTAETRRYYPGKEIAGHVLGFAGEDNQGLEGLEKKYDKMLKGPDYTLIQMRDALGRPFYVNRPPQEESEIKDLVLTIDKDIQYTAEQALKKTVEETRAKNGHAIVVDVDTGEILAMAVVPFFNPNVFWTHQPNQWRNRAVTDTFEPGSTIKAYLLGAALDSSLVSPVTKFFCENGEYRIGTNTIHDHDRKGHGMLSVSEIITFSSNIGAVKIGQRIGYKKFHEYLEKFGFGHATEIDLPGEQEGYLRPVKDAREIERATSFFGQGLTVNSLQLVMAMASIANGGKLMRPYVVKAVKDQQGKVVKETHPQVVRKVMSPDTARTAVQILETVVKEKGGTGSLAAIKGYRVAGKTGTSQKVDPLTKRYSGKNYVTLFVGFVPVEKPRLAILVLVDEPEAKKYGGLVAAPVFREIGAWSLNHLRVLPDVRMARADEMVESGNPRNNGSPLHVEVSQEGPGMLPDFRGQTMREVLTGGKSLGVKVSVDGTGLAVAQRPEPGCPLSKVTEVSVSFRPPS